MAIVKELETPQGKISIVHSPESGTFTYYQNGCSHSEVDSQGVSTCTYIHLMYHTIMSSQAKNVLMLGCGGGTLATMLDRQGCRVTAVDISADSFVLAKRYFQMPQTVHCVIQDGLSFIANATQPYDAIAIDVFDGFGAVPQPFTTESFFRCIRNILKPGGVVAMNVIVDHDFDMLADRIAKNMESASLPPLLLDWDGGTTDRNIVIAAGMQGDLTIEPEALPASIRPELNRLIQRNIRSRLYQPQESHQNTSL